MKMSDQKSNDQCQNESEHNAEQKRRKLDENEKELVVATTSAAAAAAAAEPKSITNIYYDCLERIFELLDLESLLNVAGTCKRLQIAAAAKFGDEFGKLSVKLFPYCSNYGYRTRIRKHRDEIQVVGLKFCFPFLRCFGAKISDLSYRSFTGTRNYNLERHIGQYCGDTLTRIKIRDHTAFPIGCFAKPFKNVVKVELSSISLENYLPKFVDWFPNLYLLRLSQIEIDEAAIAVHFPRLKHLSITCDKSNRWTSGHAAKLLHVNPKLKSLTVSSLDKVLNMISKHSHISKFVSMSMFIVDVYAHELNRFASAHPSIEKLTLCRYRLTADNALMFIHQLNALKQFIFHVKDQPECDRLLNQLDGRWKCEHEDSIDRTIKITLTIIE